MPTNMVPILAAYLPALAALTVAAAGALLLRGRRGAWTAVAAATAVSVGWALLSPGVQALWAPRGLLEHLAAPAVAVTLAAALAIRFGRPRALTGAATLFAAWWIAGAPAARPEFWRVGFAILAGTWLLHRLGAGEGRRALAAALTLWAGLVVAGAPGAWIGASLVLAGAAAGVSVGGAMPAALLAMGIVAADVAAGRLMRGGVGLVDLVCLAAIAAPAAGGWAERALGRRLGRAGIVAAPVLVAAVAVLLAWVAARALRA